MNTIEFGSTGVALDTLIAPQVKAICAEAEYELRLNSPVPPFETGLNFDAPYLVVRPLYAPSAEESQFFRDSANYKSDHRAEVAPFVGAMVNVAEANRATRLGAVAVLAKVWYSDREDGIYGRRSGTIAEAIIAEYPEAAKDPQIMNLLSEEVKTDGGQRDQQADKILTNEILKGLLARALRSGDMAAAIVLGETIQLTNLRDSKMAAVRQEGIENHIDVKAKYLGKGKTTSLALGQVMMVGSKTGSAINRAGLAVIGASNVLCWGSFWQMKRSVKKQLRGLFGLKSAVSPESLDKYRQLVGGQYATDAEGEPVEALRAA